MRLNRTSLGGFALLLAALPVWGAHVYTAMWSVTRPTMVGGSEIKPGHYMIKAEEGQSTMQIMDHGKMVAEVPAHWIQLPSKAATSQVEMDSSNKVTSVEFDGKTAALDFN
jgi:hypothetical protein